MFKTLVNALRTRISGAHDAATIEAPRTTGGRIPLHLLESIIGARVVDLSLYERALTHRSVLRGRSDSHLVSNERLEFLGDAVLGFITAEHLHHAFPNQDEGFLTRLRAKLVNGQALAQSASAIHLGDVVLISHNMEEAGGRDNPTILADAFEALIGAIYLDLGLDKAREFIRRTIFEDVDLTSLAEQHDNYKSLLLEYAQGKGWPQPHYRLMSEDGPSHEKIFTVEVLLRDLPYGRGTATSKKRAEQNAASEALRRIHSEQKGG